MSLPVDLRQRIAEFLIPIPVFMDSRERRAVAIRAGFDDQIVAQIDFSGSPREFVHRLISLCLNYGALQDGRNALVAILETVREDVGYDARELCDTFITALNSIGLTETNIPSMLPFHEKVVAFLTSLPNIHAFSTQESLIFSAGLDPELQNQISFGAPPTEFARLLVPTLTKYGTLNDGRNSLIAILEAAKQYVGREKQMYCDVLIQELRSSPIQNPLPIAETWRASDLDILHDIETELGVPLSECDDGEIQYRYNRYVLDSATHVIGLNLSDGSLSKLPLSIKLLTHIEKIFLTNNQFKEFPPELLALERLTSLDLGKNYITKLPQEITSLRYLKSLSLRANQLESFSIPEEMFNRLQMLDLTNNHISKLPTTIGEIKLRIKWKIDDDYKGLYLEGNPIEVPPVELIENGNESIRTYFRSLESESRLIRECKVLLVGEGGAGKTSLVKRLCEGKFDPNEEPTDGINISRWTAPINDTSLEIKFWDFGGQEIMHATHQFFLSKRGVYILILDGRKDEKADYWLKHIEAFGGNSPVLVVLNKIDTNHRFDVNRQSLQDKFKSIKGFYRISCADGTGLEQFLNGLWHTANNAEISKMTLPQNWSVIKSELENKNEDFISHEKYIQFCEQQNINEQDSQETLIELLHDLGVILHFKDPELFGTYVLNPEWVTSAVYRIINSRQAAEAHGVLSLYLLNEILNSGVAPEKVYLPDKHHYIISLMKKFELCYSIDEQTILLPELLDIQEPLIYFDYEKSLKFILEYDFLPMSIMSRFIVNMHNDIKNNLRWRTGVVLEDKVFKAVAVIKSDVHEKRIYIYIDGEQRRDYLATIRKTFNTLSNKFENIDVKQLIPLPGYKDVIVDYEDLVGHELSGERNKFIGEIRKSVNVEDLLNGIERKEERVKVEQLKVEQHNRIVNVHDGNYYDHSQHTEVKTMPDETTTPASYQPHGWEKAIVYVAGLLFIGVISFLVIRNQTISDPNLVVMVRILLSLFTGAFGATIPGMLNVDLSGKGLLIRASGALALFVIAFFLTPKVL